MVLSTSQIKRSMTESTCQYSSAGGLAQMTDFTSPCLIFSYDEVRPIIR